MLQAGVVDPNQRKQLLTDLTSLIRLHRSEGYQPLLLIDANGDYNDQHTPDKDLQKFLKQAHLTDPFYNKFGISPRTSVAHTGLITSSLTRL